MGITHFSMKMIRHHGGERSGIRHLLVGCQNLYDGEHYGEIAQDYYKGLGQDVVSVDITGCNNSIKHDLREPLNMEQFDFISQHGTLEHIESSEGFYLAHKHLHEVLKIGGIIVHENPKIENWPGHGFHYLTQAFYIDLSSHTGLEMMAIGEHPAMSNTKNGWNIYCVLKKTSGEFIDRKMFDKFDYRKI